MTIYNLLMAFGVVVVAGIIMKGFAAPCASSLSSSQTIGATTRLADRTATDEFPLFASG